MLSLEPLPNMQERSTVFDVFATRKNLLYRVNVGSCTLRVKIHKRALLSRVTKISSCCQARYGIYVCEKRVEQSALLIGTNHAFEDLTLRCDKCAKFYSFSLPKVGFTETDKRVEIFASWETQENSLQALWQAQNFWAVTTELQEMWAACTTVEEEKVVAERLAYHRLYEV